MKNDSQIIIYQTKDGKTKLQVKFEGETAWLSQAQMAELFDCSIDNISLHLKNIFKEKELDEHSVIEEYSITAAEIISERVNHTKQNMGLINFPGMNPIKRDIYIAKNYLDEKELELLNRIVDAYLSFAEIQARGEKAMKMTDWIKKLDEYLSLLGKGILKNSGSVSASDAEIKAETEFTSYKRVQDKHYISDFDKAAMKLLKKAKK